MATIINNPGDTPRDGGNGAGWITAVVVIIILVLLALFLLPRLFGSQTAVTPAANDTSGTYDSGTVPVTNTNTNTTVNSTTTTDTNTTNPVGTGMMGSTSATVQ